MEKQKQKSGNNAQEISFEWQHHRISSSQNFILDKQYHACESNAEEVSFEWQQGIHPQTLNLEPSHSTPFTLGVDGFLKSIYFSVLTELRM